MPILICVTLSLTLLIVLVMALMHQKALTNETANNLRESLALHQTLLTQALAENARLANAVMSRDAMTYSLLNQTTPSLQTSELPNPGDYVGTGTDAAEHEQWRSLGGEDEFDDDDGLSVDNFLPGIL
jgi:hypothetical protein